MKNIILISILCFVKFALNAQAGKRLINNNGVVYITTAKTSSLIFQQPVRHIDRGTTNILAQQVREADNIVLLKAAVDKFKATNLSVITDDGNAYAFEIRYDSIAAANTYYVQPDSSVTPVEFNHETISPAAITSYCNAILNLDKTIHGIKNKKWGIAASVSGMYIKDNVLFFQLVIGNQSTIDYDIDFVRFYITDKVKPKRTAVQELEQTPLRITGNVRTVKAGNENVIVVALQKFTIPDAKYLAIQVVEKNGGRHINLKIQNGRIVKAKQLADLK